MIPRSVGSGLLVLLAASLALASDVAQPPNGPAMPKRIQAAINVNRDPLLAATENGAVRGKYNTDILRSIKDFFGGDVTGETRVWAGVPFAAPPVGQLRWRSPQPVPRNWGSVTAEGIATGEIRDATSFPNACPQNWITTAKQSEDCLYLNIFVPPAKRTPPGTKLPVMVWIYGGAFTIGDSYQTGVNNPRYVIERRDVVVVTINYRLGAFGFFDTDETGANFGIEDQRAALEWIQRNIENFHGDPKRVMIYGLSAGATSVAIHLTSPLSRPGLFSRGIHQSGPLGTQMRRRADIQKVSRELAASLNCLKADKFTVDVACMRSKTMKEILVETKEELNDPTSRPRKKDKGEEDDDDQQLAGNGHLDAHAPDNHVATEIGDQYRWWPSIDGKNIVGQPRDLIRQGRYLKDVAIIFGVTSDEGGYWMLPLDHLIYGKARAQRGFNATAHAAHLRRTFGADAPKIMRMYPVHPDVEGNVNEMIRLTTDYVFTCPTQQAAETMTAQGASNIFMYEWTQPGFPPYGRCTKIACHATELPLMFRTLWPQNADRKRLQKHILEYWTNFAATGDPNLRADGSPAQGVPAWPKFDPVKRQHQELGNVVGARGPLRESFCEVWNNDLGYGFDSMEPSWMDIDATQKLFFGVV